MTKADMLRWLQEVRANDRVIIAEVERMGRLIEAQAKEIEQMSDEMNHWRKRALFAEQFIDKATTPSDETAAEQPCTDPNPGHMGWLVCRTHNREIMAKIDAFHEAERAFRMGDQA